MLLTEIALPGPVMPAPTGVAVPLTSTAAGAPTATNYCIISQNGSWYAWKHVW